MKGYKAFNKDLTCNGFQYKEGEIFKTDKAEICSTGFHFCENPFDILNYYDLCTSEFHEIEATGEIKGHKNDTKKCTTEIKIGAKLDLKAFVKASINFVFSKTKVKSGYYSKSAQSGNSSQSAQLGNSSQSAQSGNYSKSAQSGDYSKSAQSGNSSQIESTGKHNVMANIGINGKAKGIKGNWITLAEYKQDKKYNYIPVCVKSIKIDGKRIKENVWYELKNKKFAEVK